MGLEVLGTVSENLRKFIGPELGYFFHKHKNVFKRGLTPSGV